MNKQQVKVMVGQTWSAPSGDGVKVDNLECGLVYFTSLVTGFKSYQPESKFKTDLTFVPANDLEWLACQDGIYIDGNSYSVTDGKVDGFIGKGGDFWTDEIRDMRVHLGLETNEITTEEIDMLTKEDKPVYTQDMINAGEGIELGMLYLDCDGHECEFIGEINDGCFWIGRLTDDGIHPRCLSVSERGDCKPIDQRTDQEKLIDKMVSVFEQAACKETYSLVDCMKAVVDEFNVSEK